MQQDEQIMEEMKSVPRRSQRGQVTVAEPPTQGVVSRRKGHAISVTSTLLEWEPSQVLAAGGRNVYRLQVRCETGSDGVRRFYPAGPLTAFLLHASAGGLEILKTTYKMEDECRSSYHAMRLLWQRTSRQRELLDRTFRRVEDLSLSPPERVTPDRADILPESIGCIQGQECRKWTVTELIEHGRAAATEAGYAKPSAELRICYGVLVAARLNPIDIETLTEESASGLIRSCLFDFGPADPRVDDATVELVIERLLAAIERHQGDSSAEFNAWFYEQTSDVVHGIAKQKKSGGPIERELVRQAMLEIVFRSFRYVGDCVHAQMRIFSKLLPIPLNEDEQTLYDVVFQKRECLGGLPLILLVAYFRPLRILSREVLRNPSDRRSWGVLLRAFQYYAEMIQNKRESERRYKRQRNGGKNTVISAIATVSELPAPDDCSKHGDLLDALQEVAAVLRRRERSECECSGPGEWEASLDTGQSTENELVFEDQCRCCGRRNLVRVSAEEARRIHASLGA